MLSPLDPTPQRMTETTMRIDFKLHDKTISRELSIVPAIDDTVIIDGRQHLVSFIIWNLTHERKPEIYVILSEHSGPAVSSNSPSRDRNAERDLFYGEEDPSYAHG